MRKEIGFRAAGLLIGLGFPAVTAAATVNPVSGAIHGAGRIFTAPARLESRDLLPLTALVGAGLTLYSLDGQIRHAFNGAGSRTLDDISTQVEKLGNGGYDLGIIGAGWLTGKVLSDEKLAKTSLLAAESFLAANAVGTVIKATAGRARPYMNDGKSKFRTFSLKSDYASCPSGHTVSAFSVASVYAYCYSNTLAVGAAAYTLAGLVALQRVYADKHWASDVFFGAALGVSAGRMIAAEGSGLAAARLSPVFGPGYAGAEANIRF